MYVLLVTIALATPPEEAGFEVVACPCTDTGMSIDCDLNVSGKSSNTSLLAWHDANRSQYVFSGVDGGGRLFECRFADWTGGIDPDLYRVAVVGTPQSDQVNITTYFTGFSFIAGAGNDLALGPPDAHRIYLEMGDGNDWVDVWGDEITAYLGPGDDVAILGGVPDVMLDVVVYGGEGNDCVLGRPGAHDEFHGEEGDDRFDSRGTCDTALCRNEVAIGGPGHDECAVTYGQLDCEAAPNHGFLTCPEYVP